MRPTDDLREEHIAVKQMLRILDGICTNIDSGENVEQEHLNSLVEFMKVFVDKCHHTKEEIYLFPEMEKAGISGAREMVASLKKEHEIGRQYVSKIEKAVLEKENNRALPAIVENSRAYIQLMIPHIEKEDNNLFPIADVNLSQEVQRNLLESFEAVETEIIGPGKHEQFHERLHTMGEIYLNLK
ncbi:MAG: hemerythrin domain-containing protein [Methanosarcina sp.]